MFIQEITSFLKLDSRISFFICIRTDVYLHADCALLTQIGNMLKNILVVRFRIQLHYTEVILFLCIHEHMSM